MAERIKLIKKPSKRKKTYDSTVTNRGSTTDEYTLQTNQTNNK
jgi:hypothetical protein